MTLQDDTIAQQEAIEKRKDNKGVWRMFRKGNASNAASDHPVVNPPPSYTSNQGTDNKVEEYVDDSGDITSTIVDGELGKRVESDDAVDKESDLPPATVGFDFKAIGEVLGKDVDPSSTKRTESRVINPIPTHITKAPAPLERSESAPPLSEERLDQEVDSWSASSYVQPTVGPVPHRPSPLSRTASSDDATPIAEKSTPIPEMTTQRARQFPSHVLKSAASIFNNPFSSASSSPVLPETTAVWDSVPPAEHDAGQDDYGGDIGGDIGYQYEPNTSSNTRISEPAVAGASLEGWGTDADKPKRAKDDWALNNPW